MSTVQSAATGQVFSTTEIAKALGYDPDLVIEFAARLCEEVNYHAEAALLRDGPEGDAPASESFPYLVIQDGERYFARPAQAIDGANAVEFDCVQCYPNSTTVRIVFRGTFRVVALAEPFVKHTKAA